MRGQAATFLKPAGGFSMYWKWAFVRPGDVMTNLQKESANTKPSQSKKDKKAFGLKFCFACDFFPVLVCTGAIHELFAYVFFW